VSGTAGYALSLHSERKELIALKWVSHKVIYRHKRRNRTCRTRPHTTTQGQVLSQLNGNTLVGAGSLQVFLNRDAGCVPVCICRQPSAVAGNRGDHNTWFIPKSKGYLIAGRLHRESENVESTRYVGHRCGGRCLNRVHDWSLHRCYRA